MPNFTFSKTSTVLLAAVWILSVHWNAILKADDPVAATQSDAIAVEQDEEKEKTAPATPKIVYYGGQGFLTKPSVAKPGEEVSGAAKKKENFDWSSWWDEGEKMDAKAESALDIPETIDEPVIEEPSEWQEDALETSLGGDQAPNTPVEGDKKQDSGDDWW